MAEALRIWQQSLPAHVSLLIVPDAELRAFHADQFPAGIAIQNGKVTFNAALTDEGAVRMMLGSVNVQLTKR
jgi:phage tail sheath gpL-like